MFIKKKYQLLWKYSNDSFKKDVYYRLLKMKNTIEKISITDIYKTY